MNKWLQFPAFSWRSWVCSNISWTCGWPRDNRMKQSDKCLPLPGVPSRNDHVRSRCRCLEERSLGEPGCTVIARTKFQMHDGGHLGPASPTETLSVWPTSNPMKEPKRNQQRGPHVTHRSRRKSTSQNILAFFSITDQWMTHTDINGERKINAWHAAYHWTLRERGSSIAKT